MAAKAKSRQYPTAFKLKAIKRAEEGEGDLMGIASLHSSYGLRRLFSGSLFNGDARIRLALMLPFLIAHLRKTNTKSRNTAPSKLRPQRRFAGDRCETYAEYLVCSQIDR